MTEPTNDLLYLTSLVARVNDIEDKNPEELSNDTESFSYHSFQMMPAMLSMIDKVLLSLCIGDIKTIRVGDNGYVVNEQVVIDCGGRMYSYQPLRCSTSVWQFPEHMIVLKDTMRLLGLLVLIKNWGIA